MIEFPKCVSSNPTKISPGVGCSVYLRGSAYPRVYLDTLGLIKQLIYNILSSWMGVLLLTIQLRPYKFSVFPLKSWCQYRDREFQGATYNNYNPTYLLPKSYLQHFNYAFILTSIIFTILSYLISLILLINLLPSASIDYCAINFPS